MKHFTGTDILCDIKQSEMATSSGPVALPILYRDGSMLVAGYRIDVARTQAILGDLPFEPIVILGRALVLLTLFEYRDSTLGPYNELGIGILVQRAGTSPSLWRILRDISKVEEAGLFVTNLPVNYQGACTAGVELWGYPKYVTGINTSFGPDSVRATLEHEIVVTHSRGFGFEMAGIPFVTFTLLKNRLIRTIVEVDHRVRFGGAHTVSLNIIGDGPTAATVKALGLETVRPAFAFRTDALKSILPEGKDMGSIAA